ALERPRDRAAGGLELGAAALVGARDCRRREQCDGDCEDDGTARRMHERVGLPGVAARERVAHDARLRNDCPASSRLLPTAFEAMNSRRTTRNSSLPIALAISRANDRQWSEVDGDCHYPIASRAWPCRGGVERRSAEFERLPVEAVEQGRAGGDGGLRRQPPSRHHGAGDGQLTQVSVWPRKRESGSGRVRAGSLTVAPTQGHPYRR